MSIEEQIRLLLGERRLVELGVPRGYVQRRLYLEASLFSEMTKERDDEYAVERFARLEADLAVFCESPTLDPAYLFLLRPPESAVWEIRSKADPQIRVFGQFAKTNCFVATNYEYRDYLGDIEAWQWNEEIKRAKCIWRSLFPAHSPMRTKDINKVITGAIDEQYYK